MQRQNHILFRLLVASCVGVAVSTIAIVVVWHNARDIMQVRPQQQGRTQHLLREIDEAITAYQQKSNAPPRSLDQLQALEVEEKRRLPFDENGIIVDGWRRQFVFTVDGTNCLVTSYGQDGKPGGIGVDCDLTNKNRHPKESLPTFLQFVSDSNLRGVTGTCVFCGILTFFLCFYIVKLPELTRRGIVGLGITLGATVVGAVFVAVMMSALHIPTGH